MAKKRKTAEDYRKEHQDLLDKTSALETRIADRLLELCRMHPETIVAYKANGGNTPIKAKSIDNVMYVESLDVRALLIHIESIEKALEAEHPHQQGNLFN